MQDSLENVVAMFSNIMLSPSLGSTELLVTLLIACGFVLIGISSILPKNKSSDLEWWER